MPISQSLGDHWLAGFPQYLTNSNALCPTFILLFGTLRASVTNSKTSKSKWQCLCSGTCWFTAHLLDSKCSRSKINSEGTLKLAASRISWQSFKILVWSFSKCHGFLQQVSNIYLQLSDSYLWQNREDSFQRDLIYVALLFANLTDTPWTQKVMSSSISKGKEEKLSKHGTKPKTRWK